MSVLLAVVYSEVVVTKEGLVGGWDVLIASVTPRALFVSHRQTKGSSSHFLYHSHPHTHIQAFLFDYRYSMSRHVLPTKCVYN